MDAPQEGIQISSEEPARAIDTQWIRWCAYGAFLTALPTTAWRLLVAAGFNLGTPAAWREFQEVPGSGTWYMLGLSVSQLIAAAGCLLLAVDIRRLTPRWTPAWLRRNAPFIGGGAGLLGAAVLLVLVTMSIIAWGNVDPFADVEYDGWAWLSLICYVIAAFWPLFLIPAAYGYIKRRGLLDSDR